jgi:hypothetical protein
VGAVVVIVGDVIPEKPEEMPLVSDDDMVEELAAHAADPALGDPVLPGASESRLRRLAYVALAERLTAPLMTCDAQLAAAGGVRVSIELVT